MLCQSTLRVGAILVISAASLAQTHVTSPFGLLNVEGDVAAGMFGAHSAARHMLFDGELRNNTLALKEVTYRDDFRAFTPVDGTGRRWRSVTLDIAECDMAAVSPVFSQNPIGTPTRVFSGSVTWGTNVGIPASLPAPWSKRFPFLTNWSYSGKNDICLDHDFDGGTMANAASWTTAAVHNYHLDAYPTAAANEAQPTYFGETRFGCADSSAPQRATNFLNCTAYGPSYHVPAYRNKYRLYTFSYFTAPGRLVANVVNFVGTPAGVQFPGVTCNRLYLDLTKFLLVGTSTAQSSAGSWSGYIYPTGTADGLFASAPAYAGIPMWAQAMWNDSSTNALKLSRAVHIRIPRLPRTVRRSALFQFQTAQKRSLGYGPYTSPDHNPIIRYTL